MYVTLITFLSLNIKEVIEITLSDKRYL